MNKDNGLWHRIVNDWKALSKRDKVSATTGLAVALGLAFLFLYVWTGLTPQVFFNCPNNICSESVVRSYKFLAYIVIWAFSAIGGIEAIVKIVPFNLAHIIRGDWRKWRKGRGESEQP